MAEALALPEPGDPPRWGPGGGSTPMDHYIVEARNSSVDEQRKLFFRFARHLFDNQVRDSVSERNDPKNDEAWLACLAEWFGWDDGLREEVIQEAAEVAWVVLPGENPDSGEADEGIRD